LILLIIIDLLKLLIVNIIIYLINLFIKIT